MSSSEGRIEVLHVDDDAEFLDVAAAFLEREDERLDVEGETDPRSAVEQIGPDDPAFDCVVVDFDMPKMDGLELLETVRESNPDLPVILFTGKGSEEIASEAIAAGVTDYLQKSTGDEQFAVLANRIRNAVAARRARREVERTQRRFRKLIEGTVDVISVLDERGEWTYVSPAVESVLGYEPEELIGESGFGKVHPEDEEKVREHFESLLEEPGNRCRVRTRVEAADGSWVRLDVQGRNLLEDPDVRGVLLHGHDVTERKEHERALAELHETSRSLMAARSREAVLERGLAAAESILDLEMTAFYLHDEDEGHLRPGPATDATLETFGELPPLEPGNSLAWDVYESGEAFSSGDVREHHEMANPDSPVRSEVILPLGDRGVFLAASTELDAFDETDVTLAKVLVANVQAALDRAERERRLRENEATLEALHESTRDLIELDSAAAVAERTVQTANGILGHHNVLVRLRTDDGARLRPVASTDPGHLEDGGRPTYRIGEGTAGRAFQRGEPVVYDVADLDDGRDRGETRSLLCIPMGAHGVITIADTEPDAFESAQIRLAEILASNAESALDRIERERTLERQNERLEEFASVVSHDLRNPLNVAMTYVRALAREQEDERLARIDDSLDRMDSIVGDVLLLARSGRDIDDPEPIPLAGLATEAWGTAGGPQAHLEIGSLPDAVLGDRGRLLSLLENLFRNAIEHGGEGVTVRVGETVGGFYVEDDGPGIDPDHRGQVRESGFTTTDEGTGFGLAIVESVAEAHGWTMRIAEGADGGARFEFDGVETA